MEFHSTDGFPETAIRLISGEIFDFADPMAANIEYHDVAHALARAPRFAGHTGMTYTVGLHELFVAFLVALHFKQPDLALAALHHDDAEFVTTDWPSPLKRFAKLNGFDYKKLLERPIEQALAQKLGLVLDDLHAGVVKDADRLAFVTEGTVLKPQFNRYDQGFEDISEESIQDAVLLLPMMSARETEGVMLNINEQLMNGADPVKVFASIGALSKEAREAQKNDGEGEDGLGLA